jgi:hypothetical protein
MEKRNGQKMVKVWRGRWVSVLIEPCHPRYQMCFNDATKKAIRTEGDRFDLGDALAPYVFKALQRYPDDPLIVRVPQGVFRLSEHPGKPGRMLVHYVGPAVGVELKRAHVRV